MRWNKIYIVVGIFLLWHECNADTLSLKPQQLVRLPDSLQGPFWQFSFSPPPSLFYPELTQKLAAHPQLSTLWKSTTEQAILCRKALIRCIDSLYQAKLIDKSYHVSTLMAHNRPKGGKSPYVLMDTVQETTLLYIDALVATAFDLYRGAQSGSHVGYDIISASYRQRDDSLLQVGVLSIHGQAQLYRWLFSLEPVKSEYLSLRNALCRRQQQLMNYKPRSSFDDTLFKMKHTLQIYRWLFHFKIERYLLINVAAAEARYIEGEHTSIFMRTIVGKSATPTPSFASYCRQLVLYPYWYVPASIAIGEFLSKIKRDPHWLDQRNMQVVDGKGRVVDHHQLNWHQFNAGYFPYTIRQSTGCDNALGVLKFDIQTPYGVYLHDTNNKAAFLQPSRFLSHGCIRLEEPLLLGSRLLQGGLDTTYLQSCYEDKKPVFRVLEQPLAIFCLYLPVDIDRNGSIRVHRDVYKLLGQ